MTQDTLDEIRAKVQRAQDWMAEAPHKGDQEAIAAWEARLKIVQGELAEAQGH